MEYFVEQNSIVRKIWGKSNTVLFIFAGSAAEFALNKAVDWLYFTGKLPADPLGRLFSTVSYARKIIFSENETSLKIIDSIYSIHKVVENNRASTIPDWAYRDVLYMLIYYSISSYEALERKLSDAEKEEVFAVFLRFGNRMNLKELAPNYTEWLQQRETDLANDLKKGEYTIDLFKQYKKHLGSIRYFLLIEGQKIIIPEKVRILLGFSKISLLTFILPFYKLSRILHLDSSIKKILLPKKYQLQINEIDVV
ncbi:MAG TPA: oxygenase MpaB family protein [Bacteroidia bacterium]|nr:oxygenase MpaB family protein [Bacteroidia bacterium]